MNAGTFARSRHFPVLNGSPRDAPMHDASPCEPSPDCGALAAVPIVIAMLPKILDLELYRKPPSSGLMSTLACDDGCSFRVLASTDLATGRACMRAGETGGEDGSGRSPAREIAGLPTSPIDQREHERMHGPCRTPCRDRLRPISRCGVRKPVGGR